MHTSLGALLECSSMASSPFACRVCYAYAHYMASGSCKTHTGQTAWSKEESSGRHKSMPPALEGEGAHAVHRGFCSSVVVQWSLAPSVVLPLSSTHCITLGEEFHFVTFSPFVGPHLCSVARWHNVCEWAH